MTDIVPNPCPICASGDVTARMLRPATKGKGSALGKMPLYAVECGSCGYTVKSQCLAWAVSRWNGKKV